MKNGAKVKYEVVLIRLYVVCFNMCLISRREEDNKDRDRSSKSSKRIPDNTFWNDLTQSEWSNFESVQVDST